MNLSWSDSLLVSNPIARSAQGKIFFTLARTKCSILNQASVLGDSAHSTTQLEITLRRNQVSVLQGLRKQQTAQSVYVHRKMTDLKQASHKGVAFECGRYIYEFEHSQLNIINKCCIAADQTLYGHNNCT